MIVLDAVVLLVAILAYSKDFKEPKRLIIFP